MSRWEFKLPEIGEAVAEGELVAWLVEVGETVSEDQGLCELMTDKATVTVTVPRAGVVLERRGKLGDMVKVHEPIVVLEVGTTGGAEVLRSTSENAAVATGASPVAAVPGAAVVPVIDVQNTHKSRDGLGSGGAAGYFNEKPLATPATRKAARDLGVDLRTVTPSGEASRVTRADVEAVVRAGEHAGNGISASPAGTPLATGSGAISRVSSGRRERRVPFVGVRRKIAQKMQQSKNTAAHFTFVEECDASALIALRAKLKPLAEKQGVKLTFLPFVVKAVVAALKRLPVLNSTLDEAAGELVYKENFDLGIAVSADTGLVVPVLRDADKLSILDCAREIDRLATAAKTGKLKGEELSGSTFTITSLGQQGGLFATPIINFPEVGILGLHQIKERAVVRSGQIVIGQVMLLSLSFDHRIVDGHVGAAFAYDVIRTLENPESLLLELA